MAIDRQKLQALCVKKGIDWGKIVGILDTIVKSAPDIAALIEAAIAIFGGAPAPTPAPQLTALSQACPCPDGKDGCGCCQAALHHILLGALCCQDECCQGDKCDARTCAQHAACHLSKALECLAAPCCA